MRPYISFITLGVANLERALKFYRDGLGLPTDGIVGEELNDGAVAFFDLQNGLVFALWPRSSLARQCGVDLGESDSSGLLLAHNVNSKEEVDTLLAHAVEAGATLTRPAADFSWGGYGGVFKDLDGHLWEIVFNPKAPFQA